MAEAKQSNPKTTHKVSKRKVTSAKKTKKAKTKITKSDVASQTTQVKVREKEKRERVLTDRHQRMAEKAKIRASMPKTTPEVEPEVEAVRITDVAGVVYDPEEYQAMVDMYDATIKDIKEGEVVQGSVIGVTRNDVIIDVGFKSEGIIPMVEFPQPINIKVGDELEVFLEQIEDSNGQLILSKQKADFMRVWEKIREVHDAGDTITGIVSRRIKGGLVVDIMGVDAFLPGSQVALRQVPDFDALIGKEMQIKIIKINKNRRNVVISRRVVLEDQREKMRSALLNEISIGQVRQGIVKNITDFGVFVDLGGVDGLLHITDMSWGRIRHPSELATLGEKIDVKILDFDEKTSRISLGLKQMTPYPWENIEQKYPLGKKVKGRVVSITDYGAFIELEKGIEGLVHISEMSWTQHIKHPSKIMNVNDTIEIVILSIDKENEKISLGIKQLEPDPWTTIDDKYPPNSVVTGRVRNLTAFGAFIELEEGIDGLVHISDMSWTKRVQHPSEVMKKGDKIEVKIVRIDHENRRISLGFKQLQEDPWPEFARKYAVGSECLGVISRVMDRGVIVDLEGNVEGFVPTKQLGREDMTDPTGIFKEGDEIPLQVIEFERNQHKIVMSVSAYYKKRERNELDKFLASHPVETAKTMADAMPKDIKTKSDNAKTKKQPHKEKSSEKKETDDTPKTDDNISEKSAENQPPEEQPPKDQPAAESALPESEQPKEPEQPPPPEETKSPEEEKSKDDESEKPE